MSFNDVISFFYPDPTAKMGEIVVDAFLRETHSFSSEITEHPIENGGIVADHVYIRPLCVSIEGLISNTPMSIIGLVAFDSLVRFARHESNDFASTAFTKIEEIFRTRAPISITTSLKTYENMVLESLNVERGGDAQGALRFSCTARQIAIAQQELIKIPAPKVSRAKPKVKKGLQETKRIPPTKAEAIQSTNRSRLAKIFSKER